MFGSALSSRMGLSLSGGDATPVVPPVRRMAELDRAEALSFRKNGKQAPEALPPDRMVWLTPDLLRDCRTGRARMLRRGQRKEDPRQGEENGRLSPRHQNRLRRT